MSSGFADEGGCTAVVGVEWGREGSEDVFAEAGEVPSVRDGASGMPDVGDASDAVVRVAVDSGTGRGGAALVCAAAAAVASKDARGEGSPRLRNCGTIGICKSCIACQVSIRRVSTLRFSWISARLASVPDAFFSRARRARLQSILRSA